MGPYIQKLVKIRTEHDNLLLAVMMGDYIDFIGNLTDQTNIMDKKFYLIISYFTSLEGVAINKSGKSFYYNFWTKRQENYY